MNLRPAARSRGLRIAVFGVLGLLLATSAGAQALLPTCTETVADFATFTTCRGALMDGAPYAIQIPSDWNGTLILFSQPYVPPGSTVFDVLNFLDRDPRTRQWLLENGYASAGSYSGTGWAVQETLTDQIETLDTFGTLFGAPTRTIAWGVSLGGMISAGLVQRHPDRFAGALSLSGVLAGGIGFWNQALDFAYAVQQLLGPGSGLEVVHITNPGSPSSGNLGIAEQLLAAAQGSPAGRARIALASALMDLPGWFDPTTAEPAPDDYAAQEANQFLWATQAQAPITFALRAELEARAGGNPSWNTGVNYKQQLEKSVDYAEVQALYAEAGLSLADDLATLKAGPRIDADPDAVGYLTRNIVFDGHLNGLPVLSVHATGDGQAVNQNEQAYRSVVLAGHDSQLLRQIFVHRAGHFSPPSLTAAERIAALQALVHRLDTGKWDGNTDPDALNAAATGLGSSYNNLFLFPAGIRIPTSPAYVTFDPAPFLRPFDLRSPEELASSATAGDERPTRACVADGMRGPETRVVQLGR